MILSLKFNSKDNLTLMAFFRMDHAISCPSQNWFLCLTAALKQKQSVLILEEPSENLPVWDSKQRWDSGDNWCWLAPRSLGELTKVYPAYRVDYSEFKSSLMNSK